MATVKITISQAGYYGPLSAVWMNTDTQRVYTESGLVNEITEFPVPTGTDKTFNGYFNNATTGTTQYATATGAFTAELLALTAAKTIYAQGDELKFGGVVDYFGLGSATLVPESSDSGDNKQHVCAYNATKSSTAADNVVASETSGIWRNPTVTYRVVGDMTLAVTLGSAFAGEVYNSGSTHRVDRSGYMITSVAVSTAIGDSPVVRVSAVANEGFVVASNGLLRAQATPAIKTYAVSIPLSARHRPQNLLNAIHATNNGGQLQQLSLTAACNPVVVAENNIPCASDVCHGHIEVAATMNAYDCESEPQAGSGFTQLVATVARSGTGYKTWNVRVRKELT